MMRHPKIILIAHLLCSFYFSLAQEKQIQNLVNSFIENMGGKDIWSKTNSLYLKEKMWNKQADVIDMEIWLNLQEPQVKIKLKNNTFNRIRAFTKNKGWGKLENGRTYDFDSLRLKREVANWKRSLYAICRRIAQNKNDLTYKLEENNVLKIYENLDNLLCVIEFNKNNIPIKWNMKSPYGDEISIYGPLKSFGKYRLPKWRTSLDGQWQFEYVEVTASSSLPKVSFELQKNSNH